MTHDPTAWTGPPQPPLLQAIAQDRRLHVATKDTFNGVGAGLVTGGLIGAAASAPNLVNAMLFIAILGFLVSSIGFVLSYLTS
ncbi:MAG: hypothetical protein AB7O04_01830 [Hyphomonadaceae bacterium]